MNVTNKNLVPFRLADITTEEFAKFKENYNSSEKINNVSFNLDLKLNNKRFFVGVITKFVFEQDKRPIFVLSCGCHFQIKEDFWKEQIHENSLILKKEFLTHLMIITVGTARGIIHAKKPKWVKRLILPTWDVSDIIQSDFSIDLSSNEEE